jgi:peptide-methionine (S)-S-oxide reductase
MDGLEDRDHGHGRPQAYQDQLAGQSREETSMTLDQLFQQAVALIGAGDVPALERLLSDHPALARERLTAPGPWLRNKVGGALDGFFKDPYLLWFVSEDVPVLGRLPKNIADVTRAILRSAQGAPGLQDQLGSTLRLVCWSGVAERCGVQIELIDALLDAGAAPDGGPSNALVNGHFVAAEHLVARGAALTLDSAVCLGRWEDARRLSATASESEKQFAFVLAALNGKADAVKWMVKAGADVNRPSADLYAHGTPLHHAVCSGSLATVRVLLEAGADPGRRDKAWNGTPLGWAEHYLSERKDADSQKRYGEIADLLRTC